MSEHLLVVPTAEAMERLGELIAAQLLAGDLVELNGELGAGKTTLTRGIGAGLGVRGAVTSPTFVLARTHPREAGSRRLSSSAAAERIETPRGAGFDTPPSSATQPAALPPLVHVDAYRLRSAVELDDLDLDFAGSITVVEWGAGMLDDVAESRLVIDIERALGGEPDDDDEPRTVRFHGHGERWMELGWLDAAGH